MYTQWQSHPRQITVVLALIAVLEESDSAAVYCLLSRLRRPLRATRLLVWLETSFTPPDIYTTLVQESDKIRNSLHPLSDSSQNFPPPGCARSFAHTCTTSIAHDLRRYVIIYISVVYRVVEKDKMWLSRWCATIQYDMAYMNPYVFICVRISQCRIYLYKTTSSLIYYVPNAAIYVHMCPYFTVPYLPL